MSDEHDSQLPDLRYVRELAKVFRQYELDEIEIENGTQRILLRRSEVPGHAYVAAPAMASAATPVAITTTPVAVPAVATHAAPGVQEVDTAEYFTSPFVGTFYSKPRPDADPFVKQGARVQPGTTVCIVEAMKLFNEIEAEFPAEILETLVENGQPVEFGAKLFKVRRQ